MTLDEEVSVLSRKRRFRRDLARLSNTIANASIYVPGKVHPSRRVEINKQIRDYSNKPNKTALDYARIRKSIRNASGKERVGIRPSRMGEVRSAVNDFTEKYFRK